MEDPRRVTLWNRRGLVEDVLARAVDDWVHVADFVSVAKRSRLADSESIRDLALGLIAEVLGQELMVAGTVDDGGFHPWPEEDPIRRIVKSWEMNDLSPTPGAVAWFDLTPKGEEIGRGVLAREASAGPQ